MSSTKSGADRTSASPDGPPPRTSGPVSRGWFALAGLLSGAAGLALSQAASSALRAENSPVEAVGSAVRDFTPGPIAIFLVHLVRQADKPLLITGTTVVVLAICAYAASWMRRFPLVPDLVFFALTVVGLLAVLRLPNPGLGAPLSLVVGLITWIVTLRLLTAPLLGETPRSAEGDVRRRDFLIRSAGVVVVVGLLGVGARVAGSGRRKVEQARRLLRLPVHHGQEPAGADLGVPGVAPWRTPNPDFYVIATALAPPSIQPQDWSLRIHGMVDKELTFNYQDLVGRQLTEAWVTLCCVSNEVGGDLIGNAYWSGVLVRELLAEAGPQAGADAVRQTSHDGWTCGTPLAALTDPHRNAMLAIAMNGQPLPVQHGFPVRMVVPGLYGYVSATKWLVDLEVTRFDRFQAYWTERGWSEKGPVKTESRIDVPRHGATVKTGTVRVGGSAWAQHTGIAKVEYQLDGGPWQQAKLGSVPGIDTWVQWTGSVDVKSGLHEVRVRATDKSGYTQTSVQVDVVPNGATGWDNTQFTAK